MDLTDVLVNWKQFRWEPFKTDLGGGRLKASVVQMPCKVSYEYQEGRSRTGSATRFSGLRYMETRSEGGLMEKSSWLRVNPAA